MKGYTEDGSLRYLVDSKAWKGFNSQYPDFAINPRNIRLRFVSDGFYLFDIMLSNYSIWLVILMPYNVPPWLCIK